MKPVYVYSYIYGQFPNKGLTSSTEKSWHKPMARTLSILSGQANDTFFNEGLSL